MEELISDPIATLRSWPLISLLDDDRLYEWVAQSRRQVWEIGETLVTAGVAVRELNLIIGGRVRVFKKRSNGDACSLGSFQPGDLIGDYALLSPGISTANCRSASQTLTLNLPVPELMEMFDADVKQTLRAWIRLHFAVRFMREQSYLGFMSPLSFLPLVDCLETCEFEPGMTIQAPGLADQSGFVIRQGTVRLDDPREPAESLANEMRGPGECFGMQSILRRPPRQATAVDRVCCWSLSREKFIDPTSRVLDPSMQSVQLSAIHAKTTSIPFVRQRDVHDCGVAALAMVLCYQQRRIQYDDIRALVPLGSKGAAIETLVQACGAMGFQVTTVRTSVAQLANVSLPCVAHYAADHYVAIFDYSGEWLTIADPALGLQQLSCHDFMQRWSGALLLVSSNSSD